MLELKQTDTFRKWWRKLRDTKARALVAARLDRLAYGLEGDYKSVGDGVSELRIHYGPGYRIYYQRHGEQIVILLCGGDKGSQNRDIEMAKRLAKAWQESKKNE